MDSDGRMRDEADRWQCWGVRWRICCGWIDGPVLSLRSVKHRIVLEDSRVFEGVLQDRFLEGGEDKPDVGRVGSLGETAILSDYA